MALATLSVDLVAKLASFEQGLGQATRVAERNAAQMERAFSNVRGTIQSLRNTLGGAFGATLFVQFFRNTVDGVDKLNDLADATGSAVEKISALSDFALSTGTNLDTVGDALTKLNQLLVETEKGGRAAEVVQRLGLNAEELRRIDPADALREVARALAALPEGGDKARISYELFGKSARALAPLLKDLAEAGQLNSKLTKEQIEQAEQFNKALSALNGAIVALARDAIVPTLPGLTSFAKRLQDAAKDGTGLLGVLNDLSKLATPGSALTLLFGGPKSSASERRSSGLVTGEPPRPSFVPGIGVNPPGITTGIRQPQRGGREKAADALFVGPEIPAPLASALRAIEQTDTARLEAVRAELRELLTLRGVDPENPAIAEAIRRANEEIDRLNEPAVGTNLFEGLINGFEEVSDQAQKTADIARDLGLSFSSAFEESIVGGKRLSDVLQGLLQDILRIVVRRTITERLGALVTEAIPKLDVGTDYVRRTGLALIHEGEAVLTKDENRARRSGAGDVRVIVNAPPGSMVERQETRRRGNDREVEVWLASRIGTGGPIDQALKARGSMPRRG